MRPRPSHRHVAARRPLLRSGKLILGALALAASAAADPSFQILPDLPDAPGEMHAEGVSADGCVVVGWGGGSDPRAFRWRYGYTESPPLNPFYPPVPAGKSAAHAISGDGGVVVGEFQAEGSLSVDSMRWTLPIRDPDGTPVVFEQFDLLSSGSFALGASVDGSSIVGVSEVGHDIPQPVLWLDGVFQPLPPLDLPQDLAPSVGEAWGISDDGSIAAGWLRVTDASPFPHHAVRWEAGIATSLGVLPGAVESEARAISADGSAIVGTSDGRAFVHTNGTLEELGGGAEIARSVSFDGSRIVGSAAAGPFLWDRDDGTRDLASWLETAYGFDLGDWTLDDATAISADGSTVVGYAMNGLGDVRAFRAALSEAGCPPRPTLLSSPFDLYPSPYAVAAPFDLELAPNGDLYVARGGYPLDQAGAQVIRVLANGWIPDESELVMDDSGDGLGHPLHGFVKLAVAPDGTLYVIGSAIQHGFRVDPTTGVAEVFFDVSGDAIDDLDAQPANIAVEPNGNLLVATLTRALRILPDGSVSELLDATTATQLLLSGICCFPPNTAQIWQVLPHPSGDVIVAAVGGLIRIDSQGTATVIFNYTDPYALPNYPEVFYDAGVIYGVAIDPAGEIFFHDGQRVWRSSAQGPQPVVGPIPDPQGGTFNGLKKIVIDEDGNFILTNAGTQVAAFRATPEGAVTVIAEDSGTFGPNFQSPEDVLVADFPSYPNRKVAYIADWGKNRLVMAEIPPLPAACSDGLDNDGDGSIDYPDDSGCVSPYDAGEELFALPDPAGITAISAGVVALALLARRGPGRLRVRLYC